MNAYSTNWQFPGLTIFSDPIEAREIEIELDSTIWTDDSGAVLSGFDLGRVYVMIHSAQYRAMDTDKLRTAVSVAMEMPEFVSPRLTELARYLDASVLAA
jgi:hypothetical protein